MKLNINTIEKDFIKCEIKDEYLKFKYNKNIKSKLRLSDVKYDKIIDPFNNQDSSNDILFNKALKSIYDSKELVKNVKLEKILANREIKCNFTKMLSELRNNNDINKNKMKSNNINKMKYLDSNSSETLHKIGEKLLEVNSDENNQTQINDHFPILYKSNVFNNPFLNEGDLFRLVHRDKKIRKIVVFKQPKSNNISLKNNFNRINGLNKEKKFVQSFKNFHPSNNKNQFNNAEKVSKSTLYSSKDGSNQNELNLEINTKYSPNKNSNSDIYNLDKSSGEVKSKNTFKNKSISGKKYVNNTDEVIKFSDKVYIVDKIDLKANHYDLKYNEERYDNVKFFSFNRNTFFDNKSVKNITYS